MLLGDAEAVKQRAAARPAKRNAPDDEELITLVFIVAIFLFVLWAQSQQGGPPPSGGPYGRRPGYGGGRSLSPAIGAEAEAEAGAADFQGAAATLAAAAHRAIGRERR